MRCCARDMRRLLTPLMRLLFVFVCVQAVDPFSNTPLRADQLLEQPELKAKIDAWVEERKAAWKAEREKEAAAAAGAAAAGSAPEQPDDVHMQPSSSSAAAPAAAPATSRKSYLDD